MTTAQHSPTLAVIAPDHETDTFVGVRLSEVIARHEAAVEAGDLPSTTYRTGPAFSAEKWRCLGTGNGGCRVIKECMAMAKLARVYGMAFEIIEVDR